jgi:hypothetical protein
MKIESNADEPTHFRVKYNGRVIFDQVFQPGPLSIDVEHPKNCGTAECYLVYGNDESLFGVAVYGPCSCADGPHKDDSETAAASWVFADSVRF